MDDNNKTDNTEEQPKTDVNEPDVKTQTTVDTTKTTNEPGAEVRKQETTTNVVTQTDLAKEARIRYMLPKRIVFYVLGILEALFAFRLVFKLLGANPENAFVSFIYTLTSIFLFPFEAIFRPATSSGIETKAVLEPSTIIGMVVYYLVALGIVKLLYINKEGVPK